MSGAGEVAATAFVGGAASLDYVDLECSGCVSGGEIVPGSIDQGRLAAGAVTRPKLADGAVGAAEIATGAVTRPKIAEGAVETARLATNAVTSPKLAAGAVLSSNLAANAVFTAELADDAVDDSRINGVERIIYLKAFSCGPSATGDYGQPTRSPVCWTSACLVPGGGYNQCDESLPCILISTVCPNLEGGRVLSPAILP